MIVLDVDVRVSILGKVDLKVVPVFSASPSMMALYRAVTPSSLNFEAMVP